MQSVKEIQKVVERGLKRTGLSARQASLVACGREDLVRDVRRGRVPSYLRVQALLDTLGVTIEVIDPMDRVPLVEKNLNQSPVKSDNPAIATALQLPECACLDEILSAIEALVARSSDARWSELKIEISALRRDIKKLTPGDD